MPKDPEKFARLFGAKHVGRLPDVGGGPFGMARLAHLMHERLTPSRGERPGRPTDPNWATRCKVPMSDATLQKLTELAETMSTAERKVSPMQVAAQLLEEALGRVGAANGVGVEALLGDLAGGTEARTTSASQVVGQGTEMGPAGESALRAVEDETASQDAAGGKAANPIKRRPSRRGKALPRQPNAGRRKQA